MTSFLALLLIYMAIFFFFEAMNIYIHRVTNLYTYFVRDMYFEMRGGRLVLVAVKVQIPILET